MIYPEYVRINGEKVKIKTDTRTALRALEVVNDNRIGDYERTMAVLFIMYGSIPKDETLWEPMLEQATRFLQRNEPEEGQRAEELDMDILFDEKYIMASLMSDYGIDLSKENMHFWRYCDLIAGLTENCILSRVRQIRSCNPDDYAEKDRHAIYRAKDQLALPRRRTREEQEAEERFEALFD